MSARKSILNTTVILCHWIFVCMLLTSPLHAQTQVDEPSTLTTSSPEKALPASSGETAFLPVQPKTINPRPTPTGEPITIRAIRQEKHGELYHLNGNVEIEFRGDRLQADDMTYDDTTAEVFAQGHVLFDGEPGDIHMVASRARYNVDSDTGRFWEVIGTTGAKTQGKNLMLTSSTPFYFRGGIVDKVGPQRFLVHHGSVTSCSQTVPHWSLHADQTNVEVGDTAKMYHSTFWLWHFPVFYFPFFDHPVERQPRKSGFLMPMVSTSSSKGDIIGDAFFWAINRSMDAQFAGEYMTKRGWAQHVDFNARPSETSFLSAHYYGVEDRGVPSTRTVPGPGGSAIVLPATQSQGGHEITLTSASLLPMKIRAVSDVDLLSSYLYRVAFADPFRQATNSEVQSTGFLTRNDNGYSFNLMAQRYQDYLSTTPNDLITIRQSPNLEISSVDRSLGNSPFVWGFNNSFGSLARSQPVYTVSSSGTATMTGAVVHSSAERFDLAPHLALPLFWRGWSLRAEVGGRNTFYTNSLGTGSIYGQPVDATVDRHAVESSLELRPPRFRGCSRILCSATRSNISWNRAWSIGTSRGSTISKTFRGSMRAISLPTPMKWSTRWYSGCMPNALPGRAVPRKELLWQPAVSWPTDRNAHR